MTLGNSEPKSEPINDRIFGPMPTKKGRESDEPGVVLEYLRIESLPFTVTGEILSMPPSHTKAQCVQIPELEGHTWMIQVENVLPNPGISQDYFGRDRSFLEERIHEDGPRPILVAFVVIKGEKRALIVDGEQTYDILKKRGDKTMPIRVTSIQSLEDACTKSLRRNIGGADIRCAPMKTAYALLKMKFTTRPWMTNAKIATMIDRSESSMESYTMLLDLDMRTQKIINGNNRFGLSPNLGKKLVLLKRRMQRVQPDWNEYDKIIDPILKQNKLDPRRDLIPAQAIDEAIEGKMKRGKRTTSTLIELSVHEGGRDTTIQDMQKQIDDLRAQLAEALAERGYTAKPNHPSHNSDSASTSQS
ncbi:MAG: hypothetical protein NTX63_05265 [Candidatus Peregrinibacteria bacterium]|nr:hypothetical protein [Candidatus Peregrinibacteria bacterium]